ncbi:DeoR/GlpR family DNA-binding transcription regulator [Brooklawnia cerclae]|uniref:DeoR family transcriptional regulator of aga operon n=1 Tax=Brooklawnia cerclae TaxID=349934 RepID=A0ABX0SJ69_9ACTN|nr:DeoR/GlpR family DNA-binding transcription regulator [Brooklawnia cerclae]NIH57959.1 DeoR family transcriptional regulator of aga operon [Brooklawnia cerclae]
MKARDRWNHILGLISREGYAEITSIAEDLGVSVATVRRDVDRLAEQQLLTRTRGGAVSNSTAYDLPLRYNAERNVAQKAAIADLAISRVAEGAVVAISGGTTTTEVARALALRSERHTGSRWPAITLVTNAINIANELAVRPNIRLVVLGGVVRPQSYELTGHLAELALAEIAIDVAVIGGNAVDVRYGLSCHNEGEAAIARAIQARAAQTLVVADSSKLGAHAFARICPAEAITTLITDKAAPDGTVAELREAGVEVLLA